MKVTKHLDVDAESFFACLLDSIRYDYEQTTGKKLADTRLKQGLGYKKGLRGKVGTSIHPVQVKVTELVRPRAYEAAFSSSRGVNSIRYDIAPDAHGGIAVTYREGSKSPSFWNELNDKLVGGVYGLFAARRIRRTLSNMERYIKHQERIAHE